MAYGIDTHAHVHYVFILQDNARQCKTILAQNLGAHHTNSATVSFRISNELKDALTKGAQQQGITLNALATALFQRFVEWDGPTGTFERVTLSRQILAAFIERLSEQELAVLGRKLLAVRLRDFVRKMLGEPDLDNFRTIMDIWNRYQYSWAVAVSWHEDEEALNLFIRHGISRKWSVFLGEGYLEHLRSIGLKGSYEAEANSLNLAIRLPATTASSARAKGRMR
jgi:hypothetical protein